MRAHPGCALLRQHELHEHFFEQIEEACWPAARDGPLLKETNPGDPTLGGPGSDTHYWVTHEPEARAEPRVGTAAAHTAPAHALIVQGTGVAWGEGAPVLGTCRTDSHCTCAGGLPAFPASLRVMFA